MKKFAAALCICAIAICQGVSADDLTNSLESYRDALESMDLAISKCETINLERWRYDEFSHQAEIVSNKVESLLSPEIMALDRDIYFKVDLSRVNLSNVATHWHRAFFAPQISDSAAEEYLDDARDSRTSAKARIDDAWGEYNKLDKKNDEDSGGSIGCFIMTVK